MTRVSWRQHALVLAAYLALAAVQSWPLPLKMSTHLTGSPTGDTGVYVWNLWVFSHQIFETKTTPMSTVEILPLSDAGAGPTDLSLHNYTVVSDVLAMPLLGWLGVVRTFNVLYLFNSALAGFGLYLLARRLTGRGPESFLAGLMFAWSPFLVARSLGHFSLAAAAPIPIFLLMLYRAWDSQRLRDAILAGAVLAWASFSDPYYAVYCVMLGMCFVGSRALQVSVARRQIDGFAAARPLIDVALALVAALIVGVHFVGGGAVALGPIRISMHTLYTPMLLATTLAVARLAISTNLRISPAPMTSRPFLLRATLACGVMAALLMSPTLYAVGRRTVLGDVTSVPVLWRSSAPGVDLLSFIMPNPGHPLAPAAWTQWLASGPGGLIDQVASLSIIGFGILFAAWRWAGFRPPKLWLAITVGFGLLALGPFVQIAGVNTLIPTPWTLVRYLPLIGSARMPARMVVVVTMGFSVLLAFALAALTARFPARRRLILSAAGVLMAAELLAAPRTLHSAAVPVVYQVVAADPRPIRVLELPTGIRDGLSSLGNFSAQTQFFQTYHGKGLIGGYLSRVAPSIKARYRRMPVTSALIDVSEGRKLTPSQIDRAIAGADDFVRITNLGYVVMNRSKVSDDLRDFATVLLGLEKIHEADGYELYTTRFPPGKLRPRVP